VASILAASHRYHLRRRRRLDSTGVGRSRGPTGNLRVHRRSRPRWAIERGLLVDPLKETLHGKAVTVTARTDRAALTRAWTAVTLRHAAHDEPVPDTLTHHRQHLRTSPNQP
jgi:hypothetical protein